MVGNKCTRARVRVKRSNDIGDDPPGVHKVVY
jgi:hypothetical protein